MEETIGIECGGDLSVSLTTKEKSREIKDKDSQPEIAICNESPLYLFLRIYANA